MEYPLWEESDSEIDMSNSLQSIDRRLLDLRFLLRYCCQRGEEGGSGCGVSGVSPLRVTSKAAVGLTGGDVGIFLGSLFGGNVWERLETDATA